MVLLAKKEGGEPIVLCDKIAQQIPPLEDGRHGVCETTERQPGPLNKKGVQASKKRKREHKRVLDRFAHRPFQPITCPSLTILEITSLRDVLCVIRAKSDACVAPQRGGYYRSSVPISGLHQTGYITDSVGLHCRNSPQPGFSIPMCLNTKRFRWLLCLIQPIRKSGSCFSLYEVAEIELLGQRYQTLKQSFLTSPWRPAGRIPEGRFKHAALTASAFIPATGLIQRGHVFRPRSSEFLPPPGPRTRVTHQPIQSHHIHLGVHGLNRG